jgi:hypothetical protein
MAWKGTCRDTSPARQARHLRLLSDCNSEARKMGDPKSRIVQSPYTVLHSIKKTLAYRHDQSYCFIAASNASGSKSNERSKLESGSAPPEPFLLPSSCRRCRCESRECECDEMVARICGFVTAAGTVVACEAAAADGAAGRGRGGRNGFLVAAE